jgi:hypothetical protein
MPIGLGPRRNPGPDAPGIECRIRGTTGWQASVVLNTIALLLCPLLVCSMSPRSIYLREQAAKCQAHGASLGDAQTQAALRKLAHEYIVQAKQIESEEKHGRH